MTGEFAGKAGLGSDESDDSVHTVDVALFSRFDLSINGFDDTAFLIFPARKFSQDTETIDYAARREFYGTAVMPFL